MFAEHKNLTVLVFVVFLFLVSTTTYSAEEVMMTESVPASCQSDEGCSGDVTIHFNRYSILREEAKAEVLKYEWNLTAEAQGNEDYFELARETTDKPSNTLTLKKDTPTGKRTITVNCKIYYETLMIAFGSIDVTVDIKLGINITLNVEDLWWFSGEDAANYLEKATITAHGATTGTFLWEVTQGTERATLNNGEEDSSYIFVNNDNTVQVKSIGYSQKKNDVTIKLTYQHGSQRRVSHAKLTVRSPKSIVLKDGFPIDETWGVGYKTTYRFVTYDCLGDKIPALPLEGNEWFGDTVSDYTIANGYPLDEKWPDPKVQPAWIGGTTQAEFIDEYGNNSWWYSPIALEPTHPKAGEPVQHTPQRYHAGSLTAGDGVIIGAHVLQQYRGRARQL